MEGKIVLTEIMPQRTYSTIEALEIGSKLSAEEILKMKREIGAV